MKYYKYYIILSATLIAIALGLLIASIVIRTTTNDSSLSVYFSIGCAVFCLADAVLVIIKGVIESKHKKKLKLEEAQNENKEN